MQKNLQSKYITDYFDDNQIQTIYDTLQSQVKIKLKDINFNYVMINVVNFFKYACCGITGYTG